MPRDFTIFGPTLATIKGGAHLSGRINPRVQLGLPYGNVVVRPIVHGQDIHVNDYGQVAPAEVMSQLGGVLIQLDLAHYDPNILDHCVFEAYGGGTIDPGGFIRAGTLPPAGSLYGNNLPLFASGNHFISLALNTRPGGIGPQAPYRFRACHLVGAPVDLPLGVQYSVVRTNWRCIPYRNFPIASGSVGAPASGGPVFEPYSSGIVLWDRQLAVDT